MWWGGSSCGTPSAHPWPFWRLPAPASPLAQAACGDCQEGWQAEASRWLRAEPEQLVLLSGGPGLAETPAVPFHHANNEDAFQSRCRSDSPCHKGSSVPGAVWASG